MKIIEILGDQVGDRNLPKTIFLKKFWRTSTGTIFYMNFPGIANKTIRDKITQYIFSKINEKLTVAN